MSALSTQCARRKHGHLMNAVHDDLSYFVFRLRLIYANTNCFRCRFTRQQQLPHQWLVSQTAHSNVADERQQRMERDSARQKLACNFKAKFNKRFDTHSSEHSAVRDELVCSFAQNNVNRIQFSFRFPKAINQAILFSFQQSECRKTKKSLLNSFYLNNLIQIKFTFRHQKQ